MKRKETGFYITRGVGFHIVFENGYVVSVQFGPGHYCENEGKEITEFNWYSEVFSHDAEVAVWDARAAEQSVPDLIEMPNFGGDTVGAHFTPKEVLDLLCWAAAQEQTKTEVNDNTNL